MNITLHILWGRDAVNRYKLGQVDAHVRMAYSNYFFATPELSQAFLKGVQEARQPDDWMLVTNTMDVRKLGMPMRSRLIEAARKGDIAAVKSMINAGVKLDAADEKGLNVLHHAAQAGQPDVVHALVDAGANLDAPALNSSGKTALHYACESDQPNTALTAKVLVEMGADPRSRDSHGNTALHSTMLSHDAASSSAAIEKKSRALISAGADPRAENNDGKTALNLVALALVATPTMLDRVVQMLVDGMQIRQAHDIARLATVKRMAPGAQQDFIRPSGLG